MSTLPIKYDAPTYQMDKVAAPPQYIGQLASLARRKKLAQAMTENGLNTKYNNWGDVVAALAHAWAGKSMADKADKDEGKLNNTIQAERTETTHQAVKLMDKVVKGEIPLEEAAVIAQTNPGMMEAAKPLIEAYAARMGSEGKIIKSGDSFMTEGNAVREGYERPKPTDDVMRTPGNPNQIQVNPVAVTAKAVASGAPLQPGTGTMSMDFSNPGAALQSQMPSNVPPPPKPGEVRFGQVYLGGDMGDPKSWKPLAPQQNGGPAPQPGNFPEAFAGFGRP